MAEGEMSRSLKVGIPYLQYLEENGMPYIDLGDTHVYDPNRVWNWYSEYGRKKK
jgi:hypothetical protein